MKKGHDFSKNVRRAASQRSGPRNRRGGRGIEPESLVYGSVDTVIAKMKGYEARGFTDVIIRHLTDDQPKVLGSMKRLREVREALI